MPWSKLKDRFDSFTCPPSTDENDPLYEQRTKSIVRLTESPFVEPSSGEEAEKGIKELKVLASAVEWSDLLLEIAMTTAFASLTDGTPILDGKSVASYVTLFALVWWVWASQVAYNARFRRSDWVHRFFVFAQVFVFCALAAFTKGFDVTNNILPDPDDEQAGNVRNAAFGSDLVAPLIQVEDFRDTKRLPRLNVRGLSMTMAISRLSLLFQYSFAFGHALRIKGRVLPWTRHVAFLAHISSLILSSICFFIVFGITGQNPSKADEIAKIPLWYLPLCIEAATHFVSISSLCRDRVQYDAEMLLSRSSSVFVIILGGNLDTITNGFQYIIGNSGSHANVLAVMFCAVVTVLLLFSLNFGTSMPRSGRKHSKRDIGAFFFQFFYLCAIIVSLQGILAMVKAGNLGSALQTPFQFLRETRDIMESKGPHVNINESDFHSDISDQLSNQGIPLDLLLDGINTIISNYTSPDLIANDSLPYYSLLQADMLLINVVLENLNMLPDTGLPEVSAFYETHPWNDQVISNDSFSSTVIDKVIIANTDPAKWFYAAGGCVLVTLALMSLIRQNPRDKYEWGQITSRFLMGSAIIAISVINVNADEKVLSDDFYLQGSRIWWLATHYWVLPPYALALLIEQIIEVILLHRAGRSLGISGTSLFHVGTKDTGVIDQKGSREELIVERSSLNSPEVYSGAYAQQDLEKGESSLHFVKNSPSAQAKPGT